MKHRIALLAGSLALSLAAGTAQAQSVPIGALFDVIGRAHTAPAPQMAPPAPGGRAAPGRPRNYTGPGDRPPAYHKRRANGAVDTYDGKTHRRTHTCKNGYCMNYGADDNG
jgi:hypothetical protein